MPKHENSGFGGGSVQKAGQAKRGPTSSPFACNTCAGEVDILADWVTWQCRDERCRRLPPGTTGPADRRTVLTVGEGPHYHGMYQCPGCRQASMF